MKLKEGEERRLIPLLFADTLLWDNGHGWRQWKLLKAFYIITIAAVSLSDCNICLVFARGRGCPTFGDTTFLNNDEDDQSQPNRIESIKTDIIEGLI